MRLKFIALSSLAAVCAIAAFAGGMPAGSTNSLSSTSSATDKGSAAGTNAAPKEPGDEYTNIVGMELVKVGGGYWAGRFEVTQKEYQKVVGGNPSTFVGPRLPVNNVTWEEAMNFCQKMTEMDIKEKSLPEGYRYALPTEEEWQALAASSKLTDAVTSQSGTRSSTAPVGSMNGNGLGLYDMRGNVSEFTLGDTSKPYRVLLGGAWSDWIEPNLRLEFRTYCKADERKDTFGFRCVLKK